MHLSVRYRGSVSVSFLIDRCSCRPANGSALLPRIVQHSKLPLTAPINALFAPQLTLLVSGLKYAPNLSLVPSTLAIPNPL